MSDINAYVVSAFTLSNTGGNPAGVVLDADDLSSGQKLKIVQTLGLSETAFASHSDAATIKLEFFTPTRQIAHCGHATIATFGLLRHLSHIGDGMHSKETIDGIRSVRVKGDQIAMQQRGPTYQPVDTGLVTRALGITDAAIQAPFAPVLVNTGNSFIVAGVTDEGILRDMRPDMARITHLSDQLDLIGIYVFAPAQRFSVTTRMFAPRYGIEEEAATGMAAGPLACVLYRQGGMKTLRIEQGRFMASPSPSELLAEIEADGKGTVRAVWVSGSATLVKAVTLAI